MKNILTLFVITILLSCGNNSGNSIGNSQLPTVPSDWKTYSGDTYSVSYPPTWTMKEKVMGSEFSLMAPIDSASSEFNNGINLNSMKGNDFNIDTLTSAGINTLRKVITNFQLVSKNNIKISNVDWKQILYTGDQGIFHLEFEQVYGVINGKLYMFTFTCSAGTFEKERQLGEKIMSTFSAK